MLKAVLRGLDEYSCTEGISSLMRFTLKPPESATRSPLTTVTGIGTSCAISSRRREVTTISSTRSLDGLASRAGTACAEGAPLWAKAECSGSINPDTNLGGNLATVNEVFYGKKTSIIYNRVQN
jgi:hypothetical protein